MKSVQEFYQEFDFEKVLTNPPPAMQTYIDTEMRYLKEHISSGKEILEVGCGYGRIVSELAKTAAKVVGIDYSHPQLQKARAQVKNSNVDLYLLDALELPDKQKFDYVICMNATLGNMPEREHQVLNNMKNACKAGGEVIVSVFSEHAAQAQHTNYQRIGLTNIQDSGSTVTTAEGMTSRRFTKAELTELFAQAEMNCTILELCPISYLAVHKKI